MSEPGTAAIRLGGRDLVRTAAGIAFAAWTPDGTLRRAIVLQEADGYLLPVPVGPFSAYPLLSSADGQELPANQWVDVTPSTASGNVIVQVPVGGRLELYASDDARLAPRVLEHAGRGPVTMTAFEAPPGIEPDPAGPRRPPAAAVALSDHVSYTSRLEASASEGMPVSVFLTFGGIPRRAAARIVSPGTDAGRLRSVATAGLLRGPDRRSAVLTMTRDDQARLVGAGWSEVETDDAGAYRWTTGPEARLVLPASSPLWRTLTVEAFRPPGDGAATLGRPHRRRRSAGAAGPRRLAQLCLAPAGRAGRGPGPGVGRGRPDRRRAGRPARRRGRPPAVRPTPTDGRAWNNDRVDVAWEKRCQVPIPLRCWPTETRSVSSAWA